MADATDLRAAYGECADVTRTAARNFYYGIRLLPRRKRDAMNAVYAFARRIDDIGDGSLSTANKLERLAAARADLRSIGASDDPVLVALRHAAGDLPIPLEAFEELIDGVEMDVRGVRYDTFDDLVVYCRRVAGSIGRLCLGVFGGYSPGTAAQADALGVALQQTNILRDVPEDLRNGRVYLPAADLDRFGVRLRLGPDGRVAGPLEPLCALVRSAAARADGWYDEGLRLLPHLDRRSAACTAAMAGIYRSLLGRIAQRPDRALTGRLSLSRWEKAAVAGRALVGLSP